MRFRRLIFTALLIAAAFASPVLAVTAGDVLNRMTDKERTGYITGAVDTLLYLEQVPPKGATPRSGCILNWFYAKDAKGPKQVVTMFDSYPDQPAVGLIKILVERACGK